MAEKIHASPEFELCTLCSYKGLEIKAESFCNSCGDAFLCPVCAVSHEKLLLAKGHVVKPLSAFVRLGRCGKHGGRVLKYLCLGCDTPVCEICAGINHSDHMLGDVNDVLTRLSDLLDPLKEARSHVTAIQSQLDDVRSTGESVVRLVQSQADFIIGEVMKRRDDLVATIRERTGGMRTEGEVKLLGDDLDKSLQRGKEVFKEGIKGADQFHNASDVVDILQAISRDTNGKLKTMQAGLNTNTIPQFVPEYEISVGKLEYVRDLPNATIRKSGHVELKLGGSFRRQPCYGLPKATCFQLERDDVAYTEIAFLERHDKRTDLRMTITECGKLAEWRRHVEKAVDLIINNDGKLVVLCSGQKHGETVPYIKLYNRNGGYHSSKWLNYLVKFRGKAALSFDQTNTGKYVVLCKAQTSRYSVYLLRSDFTMQVGPIYLDPEVANSLQVAGLKIRCVQSTDLLLIHDSRGEMVTVLSLDVRHASIGRFGEETYRELEHYFYIINPILPPIEGYYILDICCDEGKIYVCLKKGQHMQESSEAGPILIYEAHYIGEKWLFSSLALFDQQGNQFSALQKDQLLHLSLHKGTVMCMVYSPIPLPELKESREQGMYVSWYYGKLP